MDEFLKRIDAHMARGNEHMARIDAHMARGNEHMARGNELMKRIEREFALNRIESRRNREALGLMTQTLERMGEALRDIGDEARGQTEAIFKVLDRLDGGTATA